MLRSPSFSLPRDIGAAQSWMSLCVTTFVVVIATYLTHEAGHALMAKLLGYDILATLNTVTIADVGGYRPVGDRVAVDSAGPLVTLAIAIAAFLAAGRWRVAPTILFVALMLRVTAAAGSVGNPNDEARISLTLGLGQWSLFAAMILVLGAMFVIVYRRLEAGLALAFDFLLGGIPELCARRIRRARDAPGSAMRLNTSVRGLR